jgi:phage-related protein
MANVLSLALKINADASGVNLTPVERALKRLGDETDKVTKVFDRFTADSEAAVRAQDATRKSLEDLIKARQAGTVQAPEFQRRFNEIAEAARTESKALEEAARITEQNRTAVERFTQQQATLQEQLDAGRISQETYSRAIEKSAASLTEAERAAAGLEAIDRSLEEAAKAAADAEQARQQVLSEGQRVTDQFATSEEKRAAQLANLDRLLEAGAISEETFARARAEFTGATDAAAQAERENAAALQQAARITEANLTPLERFTREQAELKLQLDAGRISQETFSRATEKSARSLTDAERAVAGLAGSTAENTLKFNELSGVFAALPGPLGNIAGRISGLSSAGEGLSRIFAGGLQSGITGLVGSFTALVNPVTLALAGVTAFAAGATAVARGLVDLEDRVERLTRLANQLGVSFEFVQTLEEAGRRADVSVRQLSGSFARLQNTLAGSGEESKKAQTALAGLGVSVAEFGALSEEQQFELIGERLAAIEDPAKRSAAAIALFGRSGVQLLPFFNELPGAASDIERFGRAVTDIDQQRLAALGGSFDALGVATRGLGDSLLLPFVGLGDGAARAFAEITAGITAVIDPIGRILEPLFTQLGRITEFIGTAIGNIGRQVGAVFEPFAAAVQAVNQALTPLYEGLFDFLDSLSDATVGVGEWIASFNPLNLITDNVGGLVSSIRDGLAPVLETIGRIVTIITTAVQRFAEAAVSVFGEATATAQQAVVTFAEFTGLAGVIEAFASAVSAAFTGLFANIKNIISQIGGFIERVVSFAERFLGIRRDIEQPVEVQIDFPTNAAVELTEELSKAQAKVAEFGNAGTEVFLEYASQLEDIASLVEEGEYTQEQANRAIALATAEYERQRQVLSDQAKEQERLAKAEEDRRKAAAAETEAQIARIDQLLGKTQQASQAEQDLSAIESEIARVTEAAAAARDAGNAAEAEALAARLGELDQLQAKVEEQIDAAAQGFEGGFDKAFEKASASVSGLIDQASAFGQAGIEAAAALQSGIESAQEQARDGILNQEAFQAEVDRQRKAYDERIQQLKDEEAERLRVEQTIANERQRVNSLVDEQLALAAVGGDSQRLAASRNLAAIEQEIARVQAEADAAKASGDNAAAQAGLNRISQLEQVAAKEDAIASGRKQAEDEIAKQRAAAVQQQQQAFANAAKAQEQQAQQAQQAQQQQAAEAEKALEEQAKRNEERLARSRQLATASTEAAQGADIRTEAGARNFIQAIQGGFDPQLAVQRQQLKVQREIATGLQANLQALGFQTFRFPAAAGA